MLSTWIESLELPLEQNEERGWKPHGMFDGSTPNLTWLGCHASVLDPGITPHPPHRHDEEELLVILDGEAELLLIDGEGGERRQPVRPGWFSYYPTDQRHTLRATGSRPVTYLMFKWTGRAREERAGLETTIFNYSAPDESLDGPAFRARGIFEGSTRYLRKLHAHATTLAPGGGYPEHVDEHDVAILIREGTVETLGRRVGPHGLIFYPAGASHGMKNVGETPARYLVFEFHK